MKPKKVLHSKGTINKTKIQPNEWGKILPMIHFIRNQYAIHKELIHTTYTKKNQKTKNKQKKNK